MSFWKKFLKKKDFGSSSQLGGFELLSKLTAGSWSKGKQLEQYNRSLYVMACVSKIAQKVASTEFRLFQILNSEGEKKEIMTHPLLDLIYRPNAFQTKTEFLQKTIINKKLTGDAFWYKVRNNSGRVVELWNLRPDFMTIVKDPALFIKGYEFTKANGTKEFFDVDDIVHFKGVNPLDEYYGSSPIVSTQSRIDTEGFASQYQRDFFLNNARPDAVLKTTKALTALQKEEIKSSFEKRHRGLGNSSKIALFEGGVDYQQISISQKEMDFIESMKFTRDDILTAFAVPKPIVAITDDVNRANAETATYIFLSETIKPEVAEIFEKINEEMTYPDFGENFFLDYIDPTPKNVEQKLLVYDNAIKNGWMMINEVRQLENLEPIEGGWELWKPFSEVDVGGLVQGGEKKANRASEKGIFKGKRNLLSRMIIAEETQKEIRKSFAPKKKELVKLIVGDNRAKYYELINNRIDRRGASLKTELVKLNKEQEKKFFELFAGEDFSKGVGKKKKTISSATLKKINNFFEDEQPVYAEFDFPFLENYAKTSGKEALSMIEPGKDFIYTAEVKKTLKERAKLFGLSVNTTTRDKITEAISAGLEEGEGVVQISDRIRDIYSDFNLSRADMIARTEATAGNNEGTLAGFKQSVASHKEWIATMDDSTRDSHAEMDGEVVELNDSFTNGLKYPGDANGDPGETINCRCVLAPVIEK
jgi:HK97 family phage portal protein